MISWEWPSCVSDTIEHVVLNKPLHYYSQNRIKWHPRGENWLYQMYEQHLLIDTLAFIFKVHSRVDRKAKLRTLLWPFGIWVLCKAVLADTLLQNCMKIWCGASGLADIVVEEHRTSSLSFHGIWELAQLVFSTLSLRISFRRASKNGIAVSNILWEWAWLIAGNAVQALVTVAHGPKSSGPLIRACKSLCNFCKGLDHIASNKSDSFPVDVGHCYLWWKTSTLMASECHHCFLWMMWFCLLHQVVVSNLHWRLWWTFLVSMTPLTSGLTIWVVKYAVV